MNKKTFECLRAVCLLSNWGVYRITIGEIARWTKFPYMTVKRHVEKLEKIGFLEVDYFDRGANRCRDFDATLRGIEYLEENIND